MSRCKDLYEQFSCVIHSTAGKISQLCTKLNCMINKQIPFNDQFTLEDVDPLIEQLLKYHVIIDNNEKLNKQYLILIEFVTNQTIFLLYYR